MASIRSILLVLFVYFFFLSIYDTGVEGGRSLFMSEKEDIELEKQLKLINKPAIKSIQTTHGDIYDCVDFYKQTAFDHPLLKNHTFHPQMKPSAVPKLGRSEKNHFESKSTSETFSIGLKGVGCPPGTVPIKRVTKDDLIREKLHAAKYSVLGIENRGTHYAVVQTKFDPKKKYNGGGAHIGIVYPSGVTSSQYSSGRMKIKNGSESIQSGWTVNPTLYGDNRLRHYIYLEAGQSRCFNTRCPGFVIVNTDIPIDSLLRSSVEGGQNVALFSQIFKDQPSGNWWLMLTKEKILVGFWPNRIFTSLTNSATSVEWGGEVFSPPDVPSPPMGTGRFPDPSYDYVAYCDAITTINEDNKIVEAAGTQEYRDVNFYKSIDAGYAKGYWIGHSIIYGGPGGATGN